MPGWALRGCPYDTTVNPPAPTSSVAGLFRRLCNCISLSNTLITLLTTDLPWLRWFARGDGTYDARTWHSLIRVKEIVGQEPLLNASLKEWLPFASSILMPSLLLAPWLHCQPSSMRARSVVAIQDAAGRWSHPGTLYTIRKHWDPHHQHLRWDRRFHSCHFEPKLQRDPRWRVPRTLRVNENLNGCEHSCWKPPLHPIRSCLPLNFSFDWQAWHQEESD